MSSSTPAPVTTSTGPPKAVVVVEGTESAPVIEPVTPPEQEPAPEPGSPAGKNTPQEPSPKWGSNVKLTVGLTVMGLLAALMIYFRNIIGPLLLAFILSILLQPVAAGLSRKTRLSWRLSVNIVFLVLLVVVIGLVTVAGLAILQQAQSAISYIDRFINTLPETVAKLTHQPYAIGPFEFDFARLDLGALAQQALDLVRPLLGEAGSLIGTIASGTMSTLGWGLFISLVSYFILSEAGQLQEDLVHIEVPGYTADFQRLLRELVGTWYAFLRGQVIISLLIILAYYILMTLLGTRLSLVIALLAGIAAFIPYIGPTVLWVVIGIIAYLQTDNYLGMSPVAYTALVIVCSLTLNQTFDNLIIPRVLGNTLGIHPAGVLVAAIVATDLIGFVGLMLAAPVLATVMMVGRYITSKMLDQDPWAAAPSRRAPPNSQRWVRLDKHIQAAWRWIQARYQQH